MVVQTNFLTCAVVINEKLLYLCVEIVNYTIMAMSIKTSPELWGEDARSFAEEAERNGKLPTPRLSESQRKALLTMLESAKNMIFPPRNN